MKSKRKARMTNEVLKKKKKNEWEYTLYDLIEEVTGLDRNQLEFETERKKFTTMLKEFQKGTKIDILDALNSEDQDLKEREKFIGLLKNLYYTVIEDGNKVKDLRLLFNKLAKGKSVKQEYYFAFYEPLFHYLRTQTDEEFLDKFDTYQKNFLSKEYYKVVEEVGVELQMAIRTDLAQLETLATEDVKLELIADYEKRMNEALEEWRREVKLILSFEKHIPSTDLHRISCESNLDYRKLVKESLK